MSINYNDTFKTSIMYNAKVFCTIHATSLDSMTPVIRPLFNISRDIVELRDDSIGQNDGN